MLIPINGIKLLQDHIDVLIHFIQSSGMNALNLLFFLDVLVMVIRGSSKRSNSFIPVFTTVARVSVMAVQE